MIEGTVETGNLCAIVDGVGLHYIEAGAGDPVLLLHGIPTSSFLWRRVQPLLAQEFRTVALDLLGFGESDKPEYRDYSLAAQAELVADFIEQLGLAPVTLVGHDFGGAVAQVVAARRPKAVSRLVLVSSMDALTWPPPYLERYRPAELSRRTTVEELLGSLREALPSQVAQGSNLGNDALEGYLVPWSTPGGMGAFFKLARSSDGGILRQIEPDLARLWIPSLLVCGEEDSITPLDAGYHLAKILPSASLEVLPGVGHLGPEEAPERIVGLIQSFHRRTSKYL